MVPQLRVLVALPQSLSLVPTTNTGWPLHLNLQETHSRLLTSMDTHKVSKIKIGTIMKDPQIT